MRTVMLSWLASIGWRIAAIATPLANVYSSEVYPDVFGRHMVDDSGRQIRAWAIVDAMLAVAAKGARNNRTRIVFVPSRDDLEIESFLPHQFAWPCREGVKKTKDTIKMFRVPGGRNTPWCGYSELLDIAAIHIPDDKAARLLLGPEEN